MRQLCFVLVACVMLAGCAVKPPVETAPPVVPEVREPQGFEPDSKFMSVYIAANRSLDTEDPTLALEGYDRLLHAYPTMDARYATAVLTNASLAALQAGDHEKFMEYSTRLERVSRSLGQVPGNAQFVVVLREHLSGRPVERDIRFSKSVYEAVRLTLEK